MEEESVVALPRPGASVTDDPPLAVLQEGTRPTGRAGHVSATERPIIGLFFRHLAHGGVARVLASLAHEFAWRGVDVDLIVGSRGGPLQGIVSKGVNLVELDQTTDLIARCAVAMADPGGLPALVRARWHTTDLPPTTRHLLALARYLRRRRPTALLAASVYENLDAVRARSLARGRTRLVLSEHAALSARLGDRGGRRFARVMAQVRRLYPRADKIIAVSEGVAEDLRAAGGLPPSLFEVIYNPVWTEDFAARAAEPIVDPWFTADAPPVILGVGRLVEQKDFPTLVRAFALVRRRHCARLVVLGSALDEGRTHTRQRELNELAAELGVADDVRFPGSVPDALPYMARAAVFVLSSRYEGFGNVLVEALACGTPVVSTDCPSGPAEILDGGRYGVLVPVGDIERMATAIEDALARPPAKEHLRARARSFARDVAAEKYLRALLGNPVQVAAMRSMLEAPSNAGNSTPC